MLARSIGAPAVLVARRGAAVMSNRNAGWESMVWVCFERYYGTVLEGMSLEMGFV